ncbi:hypothetical protein [Pseudomonas sp. MWU349]|uniref:hypothetical protein n=1 Tax=Pseudomonas sp. MWU349 TaxID=2802572 RepID=UPI001B31FA47|nr:hypothetical protein [Pseudomonas sp. MWU349]
MPTETQHLEQRVAALQSDLNTKDEQIDAPTFSDNDRELSRRSWFDEAQRLQAQLAERDALICDVLEAFKLEPDGSCINPGRDFIRPWAEKVAALSASAEPSAGTCIDSNPCGGPAGHCRWCKHPVTPVERDERADFDEWFRKEKGLHPESCTTYIDAAFMPYRAWQARAALDCPDCGDTGLEPCSKHGWKP